MIPGPVRHWAFHTVLKLFIPESKRNVNVSHLSSDTTQSSSNPVDGQACVSLDSRDTLLRRCLGFQTWFRRSPVLCHKARTYLYDLGRMTYFLVIVVPSYLPHSISKSMPYSSTMVTVSIVS